MSVETASRRFKFTRQARAAPVGKTDIRGCLPSGLACLLVLSRDTSAWVPTTALDLGLRWIVLQQRCSFKRRRGGGNERRADRRLRRHAGDHAARDVACSSASHTTARRTDVARGDWASTIVCRCNVLLLEPSNVGPMGGAARASPMASPRLAARCARRLRGAHRSEEAADRGPPRSSPLPRSRERAEAMAEALPLPGTEPCRATNGAREAEANCIEIGASRCTRA